MRKAFGRTAEASAAVLGVAAITVLLFLVATSDESLTLPAMVVLAPLMLLHYAYWAPRGRERTMQEYLHAEPMVRTRAVSEPVGAVASSMPVLDKEDGARPLA